MASSVSERALATPARPLIGVTSYLQRARTGIWDVEASFLPKAYLDGVTDAGGIALVLPPQPLAPGVAEAVVGRLDGLIVVGGVDVEPSRYGRSPHPRTDAPQPARDDWDLALLDAAIALELPFLAICRGAQVLNVLRGGTLHQHLPELVGSDRYQLGRGEFSSVPVQVDADSLLGAVVGGGIDGLMYHHQAIDAVGDGLVVTARSDDGVVEAIELATVPFGLAVQWHPEQDSKDRRLFAALIEQASTYAATRMQQKEHA